ncbi:retrotransposon protein, putative, ty1-copia subclass, partial [Tanacetum coccineum]
MSQEFLDHLKEHGIIAHRTPPYTSQHNGVSERRNRTLLDMVRSMMSQTTLLKSFWDYALENAAHILNMVSTKKGCEALVKRDTLTKPDKLEPRSIKCIFVGYPKETMGYSFYYPPENKVLVSQNAEFLENSLITQEASGSLKDLEIIQEKDTHPSIDISLHHEENDLEIDELQCDIIPICRSTRTRNTPNRMCLYIDAEEHDLGDLGEPANYKAALLDPEVDYEETFSYVADIRAIRILIAIAAYYDYEIWQMDVKTAFLGGHLSEEKTLKRFQMENSKRGSIPMQEKVRLSKSQSASTPADLKRMQNVPYASAVGSIMNTKDMFLVYGGDIKQELMVSCYTDDGYLTDADDLKSQTGYVFVLNGGC